MSLQCHRAEDSVKSPTRTYLTGVEARRIGAVALERLKGVEVHRRTGCAGVPCGVNILLGFVVPKLFVVLAVVSEQLGRRTGTERRRGKRRGRSQKGNNESRLELERSE